MTNDATTAKQYDPGALPGLPSGYRPWPALWALVVGFFMILVDSTIVSVATDAIWIDLTNGTDLNGVIWVTSGYLLAYVVPLLLAGRLGDMYGPKRLYLVGLTVFTLASAWCGLSGTIGMLIAARVVQGLGAALMTPQTMAVITRTFPPNKRGTAMALWGSVAGVAILVGPLAGGVLVDRLGWEWVFFVNVPVGVAAFIAAVILVPNLPTHKHKLDIPGIVLSALGLFLLTFGLQEGQKEDWSAGIWTMIAGGVALLVVFVWWQSRAAEPLMSLTLFKDRNFSLANAAIACMGFSVTGMSIPLMLFAQKSMGLTPTRSALLLIPLAVISGALAAPSGKLADKVHPKYLTGFGFAANAAALFWLAFVAHDTTPVIGVLAPIGLMGVGNAFIWGPLAATANRNLPLPLAGAGSGVYNMTRQVGAVLGSAAVGVLMQHEIEQKFGAATGHAQGGGAMATGALPQFLRGPFADAMGSTILLPAAALVVAFVVVQFFATPTHQKAPAAVDA
ncbi:DHA2 family efflux MFS transporter permease subunit [Tsukamurella paurometabola]|uniref:Spectinomycin tetracycline efflux pump n=1 Tax=Tsukamurella paurometabola TaxID=2061 RepID=A0A3P8LF79_TSUPA|nr:DHA2 family efflux MFS transporter permease subunit [Tsukamurella paurometabola]UEA82429.1 DHA2 family efflux MFS transporter permease subunit [Tsukamurella paurometabola]VDR39482.1 Spectinomycin tetracycline efflux pump [Tsukamurella paurometabola]